MRQQLSDNERLEGLAEIAVHAGEAILAVYHRPDVALGVGVTTKGDDSPLTEADLAAHHVIVGALRSTDPRTPVVSEEDEASHRHRQVHGEFWLIDPLDGTKEFIARNGEFTVNIALVREGVAVLGAVFAPVTGELFMGGAALGSTKRTVSVARGPLSAVPTSSCERVSGSDSRPIRVRAPRPDEPLRIVASKSHMTDETRAYIERLGRHSLVQAGSSLKFCRVAEGSADCYPRIGPTAEWDTAAAQAVVEGAGGVVHDLHGQRLLYGKAVNRNDGFVASASPMPAVRAGAA